MNEDCIIRVLAAYDDSLGDNIMVSVVAGCDDMNKSEIPAWIRLKK